MYVLAIVPYCSFKTKISLQCVRVCAQSMHFCNSLLASSVYTWNSSKRQAFLSSERPSEKLILDGTDLSFVIVEVMGSSEWKVLLMWHSLSCQDADSSASWCLFTAEQSNSKIQQWADQAPAARSLVISSTCSRMNALPFCSNPLQALFHMTEWEGGSQQQPALRERKHYRTAHPE